MFNNTGLQYLGKFVKQIRNIALVTPVNGHLWILLMANPTQKVFVIWWDGLEIIVY